MNKARRKQLVDLVILLENLMGDLDFLISEELEYRDDIPENLQGSERYEQADNACDSLNEAFSQLEEAIENINAAVEV